MSTELSGDFIKLADTSPDGNETSVEKWAETTLSDEDYLKFLQAKRRHDLLLEQAVNDGIVKFEEVKEEVFSKMLNANVSVYVGTRVTVKEGHTIPMDDEYMEFESRYSNDPSVVYRPVN
jgi:hypothetical protein